jgi:2'-5' RNA ligase
VVFVKVAEGFTECQDLERAVRTGPLAEDTRFPYHPHVTVAHGVDGEVLNRAQLAMDGFDEVFPVHSVELFEMGQDEVWRLLDHFALTGPAGPAGS